MRIISGKYKGRKLYGYDILGTRPTMDRIKESLFGSIQNYIKNSICLDLFAGSGSLGLESISNGAKECYFVDNNMVAINILNKNIKLLNDQNCNTLNMKYDVALKYFHEKKIKFDIIFLDPPYKLCLINNSLKLIKDLDLLNENGIIVCEYENEIINNTNFSLMKEKKYGTKNIKILKKDNM